MCGRYGLTRTPKALLKALGAGSWREERWRPRFNIAPTQPVLAVLNDEHRTAAELRWGLIPPTAASPSSHGLRTINARVERIALARLYRGLLPRRRCAIVADGFYEWRREPDGAKTPVWITRRDGAPFAFAGLWDTWRAPGAAGEIRSCTILTEPANELLGAVHDRMPAVLDVETAAAWLDPDLRNDAELLGLLRPAAPAEWEMRTVSRRVNSVRNDDESLIEPVDIPTQLHFL